MFIYFHAGRGIHIRIGNSRQYRKCIKIGNNFGTVSSPAAQLRRQELGRNKLRECELGQEVRTPKLRRHELKGKELEGQESN